MPRRGHQHRLTGRQTRVDIGPGIDQPKRHLGVAVIGGDPERRHAKVVHRIDVGPRIEQGRYGRNIVPMRRPVQCGRTVGLRGGDVLAGVDERPNRRPVLPFGRAGHPRVVGRGGERCAKRDERGEPKPVSPEPSQTSA